MALARAGASCESSSEITYNGICAYAIDNNLYDHTFYTTVHDLIGGWIKIKFAQTYTLTYAKIINSLDRKNAVKTLNASFEDGTFQEVGILQLN